MHGRTPRRRHGADQHLTADAGVEDLLRELAPRVLGVLVRRYEDFAGCEDAVQEALVAAARRGWSTAPRLGGVGAPLGVIQDLLVGPPAGALHPGRQPIHAHRLPNLGHLRQPFAQVLEGGHERPVGLAQPQRGQLAQ